MSSLRHHSLLDHAISQFDSMILALGRTDVSPLKASPAQRYPLVAPTEELAATSRRFLCHDHLDQVSSVALYRGRCLAAASTQQRSQLARQAAQGFDRLLWCRSRLSELDGRTSRLVPLVYMGSLGAGVLAQTVGHAQAEALASAQAHAAHKRLEGQLELLRNQDRRSHAVIERLSEQENQRAYNSLEKGRHEVALPLRLGARCADKLLGRLVERI